MKNQENLWAVFTPAEVEKLAQLKRLMECLEGDHLFNSNLRKNKITSEISSRLRRIGVFLELKEIAFLWEIPDHASRYVDILFSGEGGILPEIREQVNKYPLLMLWTRYIKRLKDFNRLSGDGIMDIPGNPRLNAWRKRRIVAIKSELGHYEKIINSHPLLAFELSEGCSVGCWFCSFSSQKLKGYLNYSDKRDFFCNIVNSCIGLFGKEATGWALPYYRTEPHDNPDYLQYLQEFEGLTGAVLCTSTAVATDTPWVRTLLDYYHGTGLPWPRFSVLSKGIMEKIHEAFTPMELKDSELLMQMKEHKRKKVTGGRILKENSGLRGFESIEDIAQISVPQGTIACATGFLINLVNKTIELISPCYTSERWPFGYRVFDKAVFTDEKDFSQVVLDLIDRNMFKTPPQDKPLRFRDDLVYKETAEGFDLISPNQIHHFTSAQNCGPLTGFIAEGEFTYRNISEKLVNGINPLVVSAIVQKLFEGGFLDEVYNNLY